MVSKEKMENIWIGALVRETKLSGPDMELATTLLNGLHECVHSGLRRRFVSITESILHNWILEQVKTLDFLKEKSIIVDTNPKRLEISNKELSSLLHMYIKKVIKEKIDAKSQHSSEIEERDGTHNLNASKGRSKEKPGGKNKILHLDDEPPRGPELYIILQDFNDPSFLEALFLSKQIQIDAMTFLMNLANISHTWEQFSLLESKLQAYPYEATCAFSQIPCSTLSTPSSLFDAIALHWYQLAEAKVEYKNFYLSSSIYKIHKLDNVADASQLRKDKSDEKVWLDGIVNDVCSDFLTRKNIVPVGRLKSQRKPSKYCSRLNSVLAALPYPTNKRLSSKLSCFTKLMGIDSILAEHFMDLGDFEKIVNQPLNDIEWRESLSKDQLLNRLDAALSYSPNSRTLLKSNSSKVFISLIPNELNKCTKYSISIPRKHSFGLWYALKISKCLLTIPSLCYDFGNMEISETHQVSIEHGLYTVENITTLGNQQSLRISNIHLICNIYSNQFVIAFPYSRSILFSHLPKSLPTLSSRSYPIVYLSSNGWLCYQQPINRFYENEENEAMTLNENENETELPVECKEKTNTMMKGKCLCIFIPTNTLPTDQIKDVNAAVSMNWRKIYPNGDQWINLDQEVHFYGCDGTRGFKKLNTANPAPWMWVNPKGEVWKGYQPASQLQMTQQTDLLNETYRSWREDKLDSSENNNAILRRFPDGTVTAILPKNLIEIYIPTLGSITLQNGNFHLRNEDGSEIHFSKEITYTTPSGFPIIIDEKMSQLKFERCEIDLKSMEVKKTNENSKKNIEDTALNQDSQITSCLNTPLLPFEPRQLFMINRNEGTVFHTHLSLSFFVRCTSRMREPILEIQELKRPSLQFGATHKATRYPTLNDSLRSKIVSIWSPLQSIQYAPCISDKKILTDKDPIQNQMTKKVVKDENNIKVKLESKYSESLVTKTLPITPTTFQSSSQLYPLPLLLSDSVRNEYIALNNPTLQMESPIEAQIQPITPTNSFKEIYTFEGIFKTPTGDQKVISWEKGG